MDALPLVIFLLWVIHIAVTSKVLMIPFEHHGHVRFSITSGKALQVKGHEVKILAAEENRPGIEAAGLKIISWKPKNAKSIKSDPEMTRMTEQFIKQGRSLATLKAAKEVFTFVARRAQEQCIEIMENKVLMKRIQAEHFDLAVVDATPFGRCTFIIPWMHSIRYVSLVWGHDPWAARVPGLPSVEPAQVTTFSNQMTFPQRLINFFAFHAMRLMKYSLLNDDSLVPRFVPDKPAKTLSDLFQDSEIHLVNSDAHLIDYPRVSAPHYIFLGVTEGTPPKPLDEKVAQFVNSSDSLVVVSFGSLMKMTQDILIRMLLAFNRIPEVNFIIRYQGQPPKFVPSNVKLMKWVPQNDLLGNPRTKGFWTHCGLNGQLEGVFHGVPMLMTPLFGDQFHNAARAEYRKYGKIINIFNASDEDIYQAMKEILQNPVYSLATKKASEISKALPKAHETFAFWVDHVLRFGSDHLRPTYVDMPLYKYFMLDVMLFLFVMFLLIFLLSWKCLKCCCRCICCRKIKEKQL